MKTYKLFIYFALILVAVGSFSFRSDKCKDVKTEITTTLEHCDNGSISEENTMPSSQFVQKVLYKGTLGETKKIWLYLTEQEQPCGGNRTILNAMYKYDSQEKWILLDVSTDSEKQNFCMVEDRLTGIILLEDLAGVFRGTWVSPNAKKQYKVILEEIELEKKMGERLDEILFDDLIYNKNDC